MLPTERLNVSLIFHFSEALLSILGSTASGHCMYSQWSLYVQPVVNVCTASGHCMYSQWSLYVQPSGHCMYRQWSMYVQPVVNVCTASGHYVQPVVTVCTASGHYVQCATSVVFKYNGVFVHPCVSFRSDITARFQILTHCSLITSFIHHAPSDMFLRLTSISSARNLTMLHSYPPFPLLSDLLILHLFFVYNCTKLVFLLL